MAVLSVADKIDDDVVLELSAPVSGQLADKVDGFHIISIDVEDRRIDGLGNISAVSCRAGEARVGGKTNLVVDDKMYSTAGGEGRQGVETEAFIHDTLGSHGSIAVEEHAHGSAMGLLVIVVVLNSPSLA